MKVAIVYDRVNKFGGAERFLQTILEVFPSAPLYTLVHEPKRSSWVGNHEVFPTFLNKIKFLRTRHEILSPIAALAFETLDLRSFDLIISVTSSDSKSVITLPHQTHICICLTPTRYLWSGLKHYKKDPKMRFLPKFIFNYFRFVDKLHSNRPDFYVAISKEVQGRLQKYYQKESFVIHPSVDSQFFAGSPKPKAKRKYFLVVSRLVPYKKIDLVIDTFNKNKQKLIVAGEGSDYTNLRKKADKNITFVGQVSDKKLKEYYQYAKAVIVPQHEDFGLVPLEAQATGTPVIAYKKGGAKETIIDGKTGLFFNKQTTASLQLALNKFKKVTIKYSDCVENAKKFNSKEFKEKLLNFINDAV